MANHHRHPHEKNPVGYWHGQPIFNRHELISMVAYGFYEERGKIDGHDLEDWLTAEQEVESFLFH